MGAEFFLSPKPVTPLSLQLTWKENKTYGDRPISVTSHLCLRMNEFSRSFLRKDVSEHKTRGNTKRHWARDQGEGEGKGRGNIAKWEMQYVVNAW